MTNKTDRRRNPRGSARQGARRGTVYEQIAKAREKREEALSRRDGADTTSETAGTIAALRGKDAPAPLSREELARPDPEFVPPPIPDPKEQEPEVTPPPERSLEELVTAAEVMESAPQKGNGQLWVASLTIAALVVGSVAWFSRPASTPTDEITPAVALEADAPSVFANGTLSLSSPEAGEALELALESSAWSGLTVVAPDAPSQPGPDVTIAAPETAAAPVSTPTQKPRPRPASLVRPEEPDDAASTPDADAVVEVETPSPDPLSEENDTVTAEASELNPAQLREIRVVLNAPRTVPDASLAAVINALEESGANADPRRVNLTISNSNVRYFHAGDAEAAAAIADGIGARLRDFTDFEPAPPEGLVEIWMAGREVGAAPEVREGPLDQLARDLRQLERDLRRALGGN